MGQVTIYLDPEHEQKLKDAARAAGLPVSRWLANLIAERTRADWPQEVRELAGAWDDFPDAEAIRSPAARDVRRSRL